MNLLDICIVIFIIGMVYVLAWYSIVTEKEKINPIFHKDNNIRQEIIYQPQKDTFDKLEYKENDLLKSSPIPRHPRTYGDASISPSELDSKIIKSRNPES